MGTAEERLVVAKPSNVVAHRSDGKSLRKNGVGNPERSPVRDAWGGIVKASFDSLPSLKRPRLREKTPMPFLELPQCSFFGPAEEQLVNSMASKVSEVVASP